jgi:hypothetical protein
LDQAPPIARCFYVTNAAFDKEKRTAHAGRTTPE